MMGAFMNTIILIAGGLWVLASAIPRLLNPEPTNVLGMIGFALVGIVVNGVAAKHDRAGRPCRGVQPINVAAHHGVGT